MDYVLKLRLLVLCEPCNEPRTVKGSGTCPSCGAALPVEGVGAVRTELGRRRTAFKGRLNRLHDEMQRVTNPGLPFKTEGEPLSSRDHLDVVLRPAMEQLSARSAEVSQLFATSTWDPDEADCIETFTKLVGELTRGLALVTELREKMPPLEWRAVHRELTRAACEQVRGQVTIAMTIVAPDADEARRLQADAASALDQSERHARRVAALINRIRALPDDGPFQQDGALDVAALTWSSTGQTDSSINAGAQLFREAFADVPGVAALPDEYALLLLPTLALSAQEVDHELLVQRATQLRGVLDTADTTPAWINDPGLLVNRVYRGLERIVGEAERLGRHVRHGLPRIDIMRSHCEAYRQLIEGALRDLGGVVLVASRASRNDDNATYEYDVVEGIQAGEIVSEFDRLGGPCGQAIDMLLRNANAHADYEVTDSGVVARERRIEGGRVVSGGTPVAFSDAEFYEQVISLQEALLALQLAVLPWLWRHADPGIVQAVAAQPLTDEQRGRTIALIGGLAGLQDVVVSRDANSMIVSARAREGAAERQEVGMLTVVPAALGSDPDVAAVALAIEGRQTVMFERSEFTDALGESPQAFALLGLLNAKWYVASGAAWTERDEAMYVGFPLTQLHFSCMKLASQAPQTVENVEQAVESLRQVRARLDGVLPADRRSALTQEIVEQLDILEASLAGLAEFLRGERNQSEAARFAQNAAATTDVVFQLQERAKALRDGGPTEG